MKKTLYFISLSILLFSCQKNKQPAIVGVWIEISVYSQDNSGNYYWSGAPRFPYVLTLKDDGTYSGWQCYPTGSGVYRYNHVNSHLELQEMPSGSTETLSVSVLDDDYLILNYGLTNMGEYKVKFMRSQY